MHTSYPHLFDHYSPSFFKYSEGKLTIGFRNWEYGCAGMYINAEVMKKIVKRMELIGNLIEVHVINCSLYDKASKILAKHLKKRKLEKISFVRTWLDEDDVKFLNKALRKSILKELDLTECTLTNKKFNQLKEKLNFSQLETLRLPFNCLETEPLSYCADSLLSLFKALENAPLKHLDLTGVYPSVELCISSLSMVENLIAHIKFEKIESLGLGFHNLTDKTLTQIIDCLKHSNLKQLKLAGNFNISHLTINYLVTSLKHHPIEALDLSGIPLNYDTLNYLLNEFPYLSYLNVTGCNLKEKEIELLATHLEQGRIKYLDLRHTNLGKSGEKVLIEAIQSGLTHPDLELFFEIIYNSIQKALDLNKAKQPLEEREKDALRFILSSIDTGNVLEQASLFDQLNSLLPSTTTASTQKRLTDIIKQRVENHYSQLSLPLEENPSLPHRKPFWPTQPESSEGHKRIRFFAEENIVNDHIHETVVSPTNYSPLFKFKG